MTHPRLKWVTSSTHEHRIPLMAVNPRAANVGGVTHPVTLPTRSLAIGRERAAQLTLAAVTLLAWGLAFGDSPAGVLAAVASSGVAWMVGKALLRDRGEYHRALAVRLVRQAQAATLVTALVVAAAALLNTGAEPLRLVAASLLGFLAVVGWDVRQHRTETTERPLRVLGLGAGEEAASLSRAFDKREAHGVELIGFVGNHSHAVVPVLGELDELPAIVRRHDIDAIVLTANHHRLPLLEHLLGVGDRTPSLLELSDLYERAFGCVPVEEINAAWFIEALALHRRLQNSLGRRIVDVGVSALAAVALAPLMLIVALAIKLDTSGSVFYRQVRVGEGGRRFTIIKFRSMRTDAEAAGAPQWAAERDPRITRVGAIIRRFRIDELPQLWNVVRGEMALVGPRPERPELVAEIARQLPFYEPRHLVRPGITGWAQVYAPYAASIEETLEKLSYDLYYVKHQSFATDAGIMLSTLGVMAGGRGAR
jgi:exopolysaccharide biosynthesis polyprenyl glycosylphosphotransferase